MATHHLSKTKSECVQPTPTTTLVAKLRKQLNEQETLHDSATVGKVDSASNLAIVQMRNLFSKARARDKVAARELLLLATTATELVEHLYDWRKAIVQEAVLDAENFPILHSWDQAVMKKRSKMILDLPLWTRVPVKTHGGLKVDKVYSFIVNFAIPFLESCRRTNTRIELSDGKLHAIPALTRSTAKEWTNIVAGYFGPMILCDRRDGEAYVEEIAGAKRKTQAKHHDMLRGMAKRLECQKLNTAAHAREVIDSRLKNGFCLLKATKELKRLEKSEAKLASDPDILRGFKEAVHVRLKSILKK